MDKQLLINFNTCYADEFDVEGFVVMTEIQWEEHKFFAKKLFTHSGEIEVYFGTNESIIYEDYADYMQSFKVVELTDDQYLVLQQLFNNHKDGYSYVMLDDSTVTVPTTDIIKNGTLAMIDSRGIDE